MAGAGEFGFVKVRIYVLGINCGLPTASGTLARPMAMICDRKLCETHIDMQSHDSETAAAGKGGTVTVDGC